MKKVLFFLFSCSLLNTYGQKGTNSFGAGITMRFPFSTGSYSVEYRDMGPNLQASFGVTKLGNVQIGLSSIFINLKNNTINQGSSLTLLQTGYRSHFLNSVFFVQINGGLIFWWKKNGSDGPTTSFIGGAGGGYSFKLSSTSFLDISPSANIMFNTGKYKLINSVWIIGNVTYRFNLKRKKENRKK